MENHQEWKQLLSAYFDGELSPEEKDRVNDHLVDCPACQKYLKELRSLSVNIKKLKTENLSPDLEERLIQTMNSGKGKSMEKFNWQVAGKMFVVFFLVGAVFLSTQSYLKRGVQGRLRSAADDIGDQYTSGNTSVTKVVSTKKENVFKSYAQGAIQARVRDASQYMAKETGALGTTSQYEPYYQSSSYGVDRASVDSNKLARTSSSTSPAAAPLPLETRTRQYGVEQTVYDMGGMNGDFDVRGQYPAQVYPQQPADREQYDLITENEFLGVAQNPLSTFSIDVDTASYSNIRRFLNSNQMPPRDSVRIEEMINYFDYDYPEPKGNQPFSITLENGVCPWNTNHQLVLVGLQGKTLSDRKTPDSNLVFLVDVSGSMNSADKLPLLKESLKMMVAQLRPQERISMVVYAGAAGVVLDSAPGSNKHLIMSAIDNLQAGGSTAGGQGIRLAYEMARKNFIRNGNNRVILATDGDFNVGVSSDSELVQIIEQERKNDIFLTVLGFGTGNLQDGKMEKIANKGNGNYYYIDSLQEGKKVLVDELGSTIFTIAKDVKIQIEFNPAHVKSYRLIGYENRKLAKEDFNDDTKDAGELGAGHTVTALYEIVPAGSWESPEGNVDPLKYQKQTEKKRSSSNEMMTVKLRYKEPTGDTSRLITKVLNRPGYSFGRTWYGTSDNLNFASAVAQFGMLLRDSQFKGTTSYSQVIQQAQASAYQDSRGYKAEFLALVQQAANLDPRHYQPQPTPVYPQPYCPTCYDQEQGGYNQKNHGL